MNKKKFSCCISNCNSSTYKPGPPGESYHQFPSVESRRLRWHEIIISIFGSFFTSIAIPLICSKHFRPNDYVLRKDGRPMLKSSAEPSIFLPTSDESNMPGPSTSGPTEPAESIYCQTNVQQYNDLRKTIIALKIENKNLKKRIDDQNKQLHTLSDQCNDNIGILENIKEIRFEANNNNPKAIILLDQVYNFSKKRPTWSETTVRHCIMWNHKAPTAYRYANTLIKVPSPSTLRRYLIKTDCADSSIGLFDLIRNRLIAEAKLLSPIERVASIIVDDMKIREKLTYSRPEDRYYGLDTTTNDSIGRRPTLANQMMCFVVHGLNTDLTIPVGYYFHKQLTTDTFHKLTVQILNILQSCNFLILRIVTDNHKSNVGLFKTLGEGVLSPVVQHPSCQDTPLFLSFDYCHLHKNSRNIHINHDMASSKGVISAKYVRRLYNFQKNLIVKPVKFLTKKHVEPSNLEKMNVKRAVQLFSPQVTAALTYMDKYSTSTDGDFSGTGATVEYMTNMYKFFKIHDVHDLTQYIIQKDPLSAPYTDVNDERLQWMTTDFPNYIDDIQTYSTAQGLKGLTRETAEAYQFTAESSSKCIEYLLTELHFDYVLTRKFNSDPIEATFSHIRAAGGGQDATDARAAHYAIKKTLQSGIIKSNPMANVVNDYDVMTTGQISFGMTITNTNKHTTTDITLTDEIKIFLSCLNDNTDNFCYGVVSASVAMFAGFIVRTIKERFDCQDCLDHLTQDQMDNPLLGLIYLQDKDNKLQYPTKKFTVLINTLIKIIIAFVPIIPRQQNLKNTIRQYVIPPLTNRLNCDRHKSQIADLIFDKTARPILTNIAKTRTDYAYNPFPIQDKPLSRKILKLT